MSFSIHSYAFVHTFHLCLREGVWTGPDPDEWYQGTRVGTYVGVLPLQFFSPVAIRRDEIGLGTISTWEIFFSSRFWEKTRLQYFCSPGL